jgi:hypothetical protein
VSETAKGELAFTTALFIPSEGVKPDTNPPLRDTIARGGVNINPSRVAASESRTIALKFFAPFLSARTSQRARTRLRACFVVWQTNRSVSRVGNAKPSETRSTPTTGSGKASCAQCTHSGEGTL